MNGRPSRPLDPPMKMSVKIRQIFKRLVHCIEKWPVNVMLKTVISILLIPYFYIVINSPEERVFRLGIQHVAVKHFVFIVEFNGVVECESFKLIFHRVCDGIVSVNCG